MAKDKKTSSNNLNIPFLKATKENLSKLPRVPAFNAAVQKLKDLKSFKNIFGNTILEMWCLRSNSMYSEVLNPQDIEGILKQLAGKTLVCDLSGLEGTQFISKIELRANERPQLFVPSVGNAGPFVVRVMTFIPDQITELDELICFSRSDLGLEIGEMRKFVMRFPIISTLINKIPSLYTAMGCEIPEDIALFRYFTPTQIGLAIKLILSQYLDSSDPLTYLEEQVAFDKVQKYLKEMVQHANN